MSKYRPCGSKARRCKWFWRGISREYPRVRGYVLDDQGAVRRHVAIFLNGELIRDRAGLSDAVSGNDEIFVAQALSGG